MSDVHDKKTRSYNMSKIRGKNTTPEMIVRRFLHSNGFRYKLHDKKLPGKPDIVLPKYKTIVDVRGCFWHNHRDCEKGKKVKTESKEITLKRTTAAERDEIKLIQWKELGWEVIVIWADCQLQPRRKNSAIRESTLQKLLKDLQVANTNH
jgi:DNA mismatch endonuclease, patch repair protein